MESYEEFIKDLGIRNKEFYGTTDGLATLRALELVFDHSWTYLCELFQNSLDAGASSIKIDVTEDGDGLIIQHNADRSIDKNDVLSLSKVFRSTKGARSVGFMGIGFKSVFKRFQEVRISDIEGWKFRFEISQVVGDTFGDVQQNLLGAVVPIWDDEIASPQIGFTTLFELRRRTSKEVSLSDDLQQLLPDDDRSVLAILAMSGLRRLQLGNTDWDLNIHDESDGTFEAVALSENENRLWRIFSTRFVPSKQAIASFLEHRKIQPTEADKKQVYKDAERVRQLLGVLPLDNEGNPFPPVRGRVYATLPTDVTLPFGIHINADWLLNISRAGLREVDNNPWQSEIIDKIADLIVEVLQWSVQQYSDPKSVKATFDILSQPSFEAGGLEAFFADERWLSKLRNQIKNHKVIPVWSENSSKLIYVEPENTLVPPSQLLKLFEGQPDLKPAALLNGNVLMSSAIGSDAFEFLNSSKILKEMVPSDLERIWANGLEEWWDSLPNKQEIRRRHIFQLWGAIAELVSTDQWEHLNAPCIRSASGKWISVNKTTYLKESLPTSKEPGGDEVRNFLLPFVANENLLTSKWVVKLRQPKKKDSEYEHLSRIWDWIKNDARGISLQELLQTAECELKSSTNPDWSILVPIGHWAKHRNRPDLVTHVLVDSKFMKGYALAEESLVADPYIEQGEHRRRIFNELSAIVSDYLDLDPDKSGRHEWRTFFEKTGAKGNLEIKEIKSWANRYDTAKVSEFLGPNCKFYESNNDGYDLLDYDITPNFFSVDNSSAQLEMIASWLEDGHRMLEGKGKRKVSYFYFYPYQRSGTTASLWAKKLSELPWVPCNDKKLRCPRDVLDQYDPAREEAPFATLSEELTFTLNREGLKFGANIPKATSLQKLLRNSIDIDGAELAKILSECREIEMTGDDKEHYMRAVENLTLPTINNSRVRIHRIVQKVGSGKGLRGTLGDWTIPLSGFGESLREELVHDQFPYEIPETTTGDQALNFLLDVWKRSESSPWGLANEVRSNLPLAYSYCLQDLDKDDELNGRWRELRQKARVFVGREWVPIAGSDYVYFDDIEDQRFIPKGKQFSTVTSGHLGQSREEQMRTAEAIRLPMLSSKVKMEWSGIDDASQVSEEWSQRFELISQLLIEVRGNESDDRNTGVGTDVAFVVKRSDTLALNVSIDNSHSDSVPINALLDQNTLIVSGQPVQFGADAAKELLRHYSFGQRASLAADLTGMLTTVNNDDFNLAVEKFQLSYTPDFKLPPQYGSSSDSEKECPDSSSESEPKTTWEGGEKDYEKKQEPAGGNYTKGQSFSKQNALASELRAALKGEVVSEPHEENEEPSSTEFEDGQGIISDEEYRRVAAMYENDAGRIPECGDHLQEGWDIRSFDANTKKVLRYIEVKGRSRPWTDDEVVELSRAQVQKAFSKGDKWYLYVVEKTGNGGYKVLPIENPTCAAAKWILCGKSWRMVADNEKDYGSLD